MSANMAAVKLTALPKMTWPRTGPEHVVAYKYVPALVRAASVEALTEHEAGEADRVHSKPPDTPGRPRYRPTVFTHVVGTEKVYDTVSVVVLLTGGTTASVACANRGAEEV